MKKFFSLFMVVAIVLSLGLTAFAETNGLETIYTRNGNEITVDIYVNDMSNVTEFAHFLNLKKTQVLIVEDSVVTNETVFAGWDFSAGSTDKVTFSQGTSKITLKINSSAKTIAVTDKVLLASYKLTVVEGVELTEGDFAYDTSNSALKSCYATIGTTRTFLNGTYKYVVSGGNTSWKDTVTETAPDSIGTEGIKFPTASNGGKDGAEADVTRKTVMFAKNTTGAEMAAGSYGIKVGEFFYPGQGKVDADQYWSIILLTTEADRGLMNSTYAAEAIVNYGLATQESQSITLTVK